MYRLSQYKGYLLATLATIILVVGGYFLYDLLTFRIIAQDPGNNGMFPTSGTVMITFNKPLQSLDKQKVTIEPGIAGEWSVDDKTITFQPYELFEDQQYMIKLNEVLSTNNMKLSHDFSFTADTETDPTKEQQERSIRQSDSIERKYSVIEKRVVPYRDSNYVIEYSFPADEEELMTLTVSFTPSEYVYKSPSDYDTFIKENAEAAKEYLRSKGINLDEYRLEFRS